MEWVKLDIHPSIESDGNLSIRELSSRLALFHSGGKASIPAWVAALKFADCEIESPGSKLGSYGEALAVFEDSIGSDGNRVRIQIALDEFLRRQSGGKWFQIRNSARKARHELDLASSELPANLEELGRAAPYELKKRVALKTLRGCVPLEGDPEFDLLVDVIREALAIDLNRGRYLSRARWSPKIGDADFFRRLADVLDGDRKLKTGGIILNGWMTPHFGVSAYPFSFWTDQAIADFVNLTLNEKELTSRAVKSQREKMGLIKASHSFVSACTTSPDTDSFQAAYKTRKNNPDR